MSNGDWIDARTGLLGPGFPPPLDGPFTTRQGVEAGVGRHSLNALADRGLLRRVLRGVYAASQAPDSVTARARALALVLPPCAVVTDRTAAWLHGVDVLKRGAHLKAPPIDVCETVDSRVRRPGVDGRRRMLLDTDVMEVHGIPVTTPVRTACDLGRKLWRFDALGAIDGFLRLGLPQEALLEEIARFKGFRGVVQLRTLAPLGDGRADNMAESALRLHCYEAHLPRPEPQFAICDDYGREIYYLDVPFPTVRYAAEYDGEANHTEAEDVEHDAERRGWIERERHWVIDAFRKEDVYGRNTDIGLRLTAGFERARRSVSFWVP